MHSSFPLHNFIKIIAYVYRFYTGLAIYYIQDLATIKRWHSKLDFSLYCAANMFQNTQNITKTDFTRICHASVLGMFGDPEHNIRPEEYTEFPLVIAVLCITGAGDNKCKLNWYAWSDVTATENLFGSLNSGGMKNASRLGLATANLRLGSTYSATQLDPSLTINKDETKIILEISVYKGMCKKDYDRVYFKLFFARVREVFCYNGCPTLMNHYIIFTPKPGTFDPNNPPQ